MPKPKLPDREYPWSPELAYVVGLLATDGNLSGDGRHVILRSSDHEQLENFKKCLGIDNRIEAPKTSGQYSKRTCYRVQYGSVQFYRWLQTIGLTPAKTYTIGPLKVPDQYFPDFLRGHLDGDGSITAYQDHYNTFKNPDYIYTRLFVRFISASKVHVEWIRDTVIRLLGIKGDFHEAPPRRKGYVSMWQLKFMKKESVKLLHWIYYAPDLPCLTRKRQKAERILNLINTITRKSYTRRLSS